jgi:amidophosphoribosyltransferase (EC 2.4.2.14)
MTEDSAQADFPADRFDPDADRLREECGVFGIFGHPDAAAITALGLHALQHRGQEAAGIVAFDGNRFNSERRLGLVSDHFSKTSTIADCRAKPRSVTSAIRRPARRSCATSSRCSPNSIPAASRSPTTATSPTA